MPKNTGKVSKVFILILLIGICAASAWASGGSASAAPAAGSVTASGYPIVTDGSVTLKFFIGLNVTAANYIRNYSENITFQEIMKKTGIKLDFIHPVAGQETEAFNMMIASQDLPDLIDGPQRYRGGIGAGLADGVYLDLTPYIEKYAPDYYNLVRSDIAIWREVTTPENKFAAFYQIKPVTDPALNRIVFRDDVLKDLGVKPPVTIDEYTAIFKAYLAKTGKAAYIPLENGRERFFMGAYDIYNAFYKENDIIKFGPYEPRYKDYLQLFADWYKQGYLYSGFASTRAQQRQTMFLQGETAAIQWDVDNGLIMGREAGVNVIPTLYPRLKMGDKLHVDDWEAYPVKPAGGGGVISISNMTKYKEQAIRFLNYGYTTEGSLIYDFGVEGVTFTMVNGQPKLTDYALHNPTLTPEGVNYVLLVFHGPKLTRPGRDRNPNALLFPDIYQLKTDLAADPDVDKEFALPTYTLTADDATRSGKIMADVNTYVDEMTLKFITGVEPLSRFDAYIAQLKSYGIEDAIAMNQKAYNIYMSKTTF
ncbi:MAG: hypothetical protein FWD78_03300 [Treponema sp.]|nr:hypothetical protein [Treponema sp.]